MAPAADGQPLAQVNLARALLALGHEVKARQLAEQALAAAPTDTQVAVVAAEILNHGVAKWHFDMVRDQARNAAYEAALVRAIQPGMTVLEIGTGSGILAMMAARAGAAQVITCEVNPAIAAMAWNNITRNGFADRIKVVIKHSSKLNIEADLGRPADLLVSEIVSNSILSEDVLPVIEHATALLRPGGKVIPARAIARVALAWSETVAHYHIETVNGFDLSALNHLAPPRWRLKVGDRGLDLASEPEDLFVFDFRADDRHQASVANITLTANGRRANCVVQWVKLEMDEHGSYENRPVLGATSNWAVLAYPLRRPAVPGPGDRVRIHGSHDRHDMRLWTDFPEGRD